MRLKREDIEDFWYTRPPWVHHLIKLSIVVVILVGAGLLAPFLVDTLGLGASPVAPSQAGLIAPESTMPPVVEEETVIFQTPAVETAPPPLDLRAYEKAIFAEVNRRRVEAGLQPLIWDDRVAAIARAHSEDMAQRNYYAHVDPEGRGPAQRFGTTNVAENLNRKEGHILPLSVVGAMDSWWNSSGHRENILRATMRRTGVGVAISGGTVYITQNFLP